jgi:23S rRNA maturation-related 3'-5' exoribonuclease YhaM
MKIEPVDGIYRLSVFYTSAVIHDLGKTWEASPLPAAGRITVNIEP